MSSETPMPGSPSPPLPHPSEPRTSSNVRAFRRIRSCLAANEFPDGGDEPLDVASIHVEMRDEPHRPLSPHSHAAPVEILPHPHRPPRRDPHVNHIGIRASRRDGYFI